LASAFSCYAILGAAIVAVRVSTSWPGDFWVDQRAFRGYAEGASPIAAWGVLVGRVGHAKFKVWLLELGKELAHGDDEVVGDLGIVGRFLGKEIEVIAFG